MKLNRILLVAATLCLVALVQVQAFHHGKYRNHLKHHSKVNHRMRLKQNKDAKPTPIPKTLPTNPGSHDGKCDFTQFLLIYKNHKLSHGELKSIFRIADRSRNRYISIKEWASFHQFFVEPFEKCDTDKDYTLNAGELGKCLEGEYFNGTSLKADKVDLIINVLDRTTDGNINFADYMFLRKVNMAWKECAADDLVSKRKIECAMQVAAPGRLIGLADATQIFDIAIQLKKGVQDGAQPYLDFIEFTGIAHIYYYFSEFEIPFQDGSLTKREVLRAIDDQILPSRLTPEIIHVMYGEFDIMDFAGWAGNFYAYRLFTRYGKKNPGHMAQDEFLNVLKEKNFNADLLKYIDSFDVFTQKEIDEASSRRGLKKLTERDYLINFLQVSQDKPAAAGDDYETDKRKIVYKIFDNTLKEKMEFKDFVKFFKYSWMYMNYDHNDGNGLIDSTDISKGIKKYTPPIPLQKKEIQLRNELEDFLNSERTYTVNIKLWFDWMMREDMFQAVKIIGLMSHASLTQLKTGCKQLGIKLAENTISYSNEGQDPILLENQQNFVSAFRMAVEDEIIAIRIKKNLPLPPAGGEKKSL